jgi:hypothetical protein
MRLRGPLANSYPAAVALVVFALIPYLALSSAINPLLPVLSKSLPLSRQALQLTTGMANAAYAFGTVIAVQFAVHLRGRRMLFLYASLFVIGSVLATLAFTPGFFIAAGFSQRSAQIQRVIALIELLRGVAAFIAAPLLLHLAMTSTPSLQPGSRLPSGCVWESLPAVDSSPPRCSPLAALGCSVPTSSAGGRARSLRGNHRRLALGSAASRPGPGRRAALSVVRGSQARVRQGDDTTAERLRSAHLIARV